MTGVCKSGKTGVPNRDGSLHVLAQRLFFKQAPRIVRRRGPSPEPGSRLERKSTFVDALDDAVSPWVRLLARGR